jgi:hypothetical protein
MKRKNYNPREFSVSHKISSLNVGESLYLPDNFENIPNGKPTILQNSVHLIPFRNKAMTGRKFTTKRCVVISDMQSNHILKIERVL